MNRVPILDKFQRPFRDLRVSVTDRCNFRCPYCMPAEIYGERYQFLPRNDLLTFEEIARIVNITVNLGVKKVRITGGEPLVRQDIEKLVSMISGINGVKDLAMTTNAYLLSGMAQNLKDAGLHRITVSMDSVDDDVFQRMNGRGFGTAKVMNGIDSAKRAGFNPIKINAVVQKGINDHTLVDLAKWCRDNGHIPRFIEYMDVGTLNEWKLGEVLPANEIVRIIGEKLPVEQLDPAYVGEVARRYRYLDDKGEFGVISSVTQPFCGDCTRLRLSPEGQIVTCLFAETGIDLREPMRNGATDEQVSDIIQGTWKVREDRYSEERTTMSEPRSKVEMYHIGG
ncbi:MAG: cyclic pyranopterin phosphate synthase MoaA [SAR202 cluster bacterium Ae2-Chloro-G2]|nr:MAG: cyclic pyranopterin phosphate synthase MoaA [SAR202 cluster bacterium Ae2-Chloro-G2]